MAGSDEMESVQQSSVQIENLRSQVRNYIDRHQYASAEFWADQAVSLSKGDLQDLYWYAHTLYLTGQHHRAAHLIKQHKLEKKFLAGRYLAARCHFASQEYQEALDVLDQTDNGFLGLSKSGTHLAEATHPNIPSQNMSSCINLLRGKVYEAMDNRNLAAECFREALREDVYCYEAFHSLVNHQMLTAQEEKELLESLPFSKQCPEEEIELLQFLYENKLKKYAKPSELTTPSSLVQLNNSLDITVNLAERYYYNCDFRECYRITSKVLEEDPFNSQCLPLHVAVLVELRKANALFYLAHKLVDMYPGKAVAWFAVGCYYLIVGKNDPARRYLSKATSLDRVYGPAWLAFGHSFAAEKEHDQAMAAYFTASHLMKGCHLPVLYIGLEYGLTNNPKLAERFFSQALSIAPEDPFVLHEMGVIAFQNKDYDQAMEYFKSALTQVQVVAKDIMLEKWEPLLNNMGHVCRKLQKYEESLEYHQQALILSPQCPSTLSAIGYVHALIGNYSKAVDYFHKALGLNRDDTFATSMLGRATEKLMEEVAPCEGLPDPLPAFTYSGKLDLSEVPATDSDDKILDDDSSIQTEGEVTMGDSSGMALDVEMDD